MTEYCLYGARVVSEFPLVEHEEQPAGQPLVASQPITVHKQNQRTELHAHPVGIATTLAHGREVTLHTDQALGLSKPGQSWCFEVAQTLSVTWRGASDEVYVQAHDDVSHQVVAFWLIHTVLPLYLTLERSYNFLHAAAVQLGSNAVVFVAPSTGGKSTLADYFQKQGHGFLSDDKLAVFEREGEYWAMPSYPYHRPFRAFETLGYPVSQFATAAMPIRAFYVLDKGAPDAAVELSQIEGFRKFEQLMPSYLYNFEFLRLQRASWLAQLASHSNVFGLKRPWDMNKQHEVYEAIRGHEF